MAPSGLPGGRWEPRGSPCGAGKPSAVPCVAGGALCGRQPNWAATPVAKDVSQTGRAKDCARVGP